MRRCVVGMLLHQQGCSAVDVTLKAGVEKTLHEHIPELGEIRDITDHEDKSKAYY